MSSSREMINKVKNFKEFVNENINTILNKSFNLTTKNVEDLINALKQDYKTIQEPSLSEYLNEMKDITISLLKTSFSFDNDGVLIGIENFPNNIKLYRIIDNEIINEKCLGKYWTYSKDWIKSEEFHINVGFEKKQKMVCCRGTIQ
jgi:hypothetical protein